ncbi:MAG: sodium-translocating pyrophosphatase [Acidimicrobiia bacterium]|nr:sodium-translocating pyrophosphatase [Acidimicrobiia bacterium]MYC46516.1 sodium-translocating pyrophosphatase [Acidimicrobiia bacterium]
MQAIPYLAGAIALAALVLAGYFFRYVRAADPGNPRMVQLMEAIAGGARTFLRREYRWVAGFVIIMIVLLVTLLDWGPMGAVAYFLGALLSAAAGWIGMTVATMANARTTQAARTGPQKALPLAFRGGAVMGFSVAGLSLLGLSFCYLLFVVWLEHLDAFQVITAYGLGASSIALFSRVGGGIYTKAADVGADLVGKVEAGIPEDDPRNPATIADNVGDNVGDVAGMGADLFESYAGAIIAPVAYVWFAYGATSVGDAGEGLLGDLLLFPFLVAFVGMAASIIGAFFVRAGDSSRVKDLAKALHRGTNAAMVITLGGVFAVGAALFEGSAAWGLPLAVVCGVAVGYAIGQVAEIWTSDHYRPVRQIARQAKTGPATTILSGLSAGMISVAASVGLIVVAVGLAYFAGDATLGAAGAELSGGIYGVAIAAIGMLATTGVVVAVDAYGPIADNAGGIAEMSELPSEVREVTDSLDSLGNTTAAVAKGFAVGSAAVTALALFAAFKQAIGAEGGLLFLDLSSVDVFIGLFLGVMLPFLFAALTIDAVGRAANKMIEEVRRQFREIPGLREGAAGVQPDSARCVDISTRASLREMLIPGALAIAAPLVIGFINVDTLGGFLAGALVSGFALAIFMANSGGAWDNAKKYIEAGHHGGKGSEAHKAAVVGDTVGDPFKDTSGPSMNILIKVMTIVSLIFASAFV